jgi:hypothetical protein
VVGNRRFIVPSITYEQHIAQQQQQLWPFPQQPQFVAPQPVPQQQFNFVPPVPQQNIPQPTTLQRPVLPATTEPPLVRTTQGVLPDIIQQVLQLTIIKWYIGNSRKPFSSTM